MITTRRTFLEAAGAATIAAMAGVRVPVSKAQRQARPDSPDAGGFLRLRDWGVCVPAQEWAQHGQWVIDGVMEVLQPARWHSWGIWPLSDAPGRVPAVFSDQYFDRPATRQYLTDHPSREWGSFNEPEIASRKKMMPSIAADDAMTPEYMSPELAADVTMEFITLGWDVGNEFQWLSPSVTINTASNGLQWLTEYIVIMRRHGVMRPCAWGIHPYNCNTVAALRQSMARWWDWYEAWGLHAPVVITEVCAEGEDVAGQMLVMDECAAMLRRGEVAGVAWASAYKGASDGTNWQHYALCVLHPETQAVTLTPLGQRWKELQHGL